MITLSWLLRMLRDLVLHAILNGAWAMSLLILGLLLIGFVIVAVKISAPFIYTLF